MSIIYNFIPGVAETSHTGSMAGSDNKIELEGEAEIAFEGEIAVV